MIGRGSYGEVYLVECMDEERNMQAMKVLGRRAIMVLHGSPLWVLWLVLRVKRCG